MPTLRISYKDPAQLRRRERNPRIHTPKQIQQIAASIKEFGFINPVLIDGSGGIIAGHGRVEAAKLLGMADVPTVQAGHLTPGQIRAYVIADNRLAELAA
jgi:ParB-like chromosome segregation protein Spo0J